MSNFISFCAGMGALQSKIGGRTRGGAIVNVVVGIVFKLCMVYVERI